MGKFNLKSIFDHQDLGSFLNAYADSMRESQLSWTLGAWSKTLGLSNTATLTRVMHGERSPDLHVYRALSQFFSFSPIESEYFKLLIMKARAKGDKVLESILEEKIWPGHTRKSDESQNLPWSKGFEENFLKISRGRILTLEGLGSAQFLETHIPHQNLELVRSNGKTHMAIIFCDYRESNIGPFREFCVAVLAKPRSASLTEIGFVLTHVYSDESYVCNLCKIVWGFNCYKTDLEFDFFKQNTCKIMESSEPILSLELNQDIGTFNKVHNKLQVNGFSSLMGSLSTFRMNYLGSISERNFDASKDRISYQNSSKIGQILEKSHFEPYKWTAYWDIQADITSPMIQS